MIALDSLETDAQPVAVSTQVLKAAGRRIGTATGRLGDDGLEKRILHIFQANSIDGAVHVNEWPALAAEIVAAIPSWRGVQ